MLTKLSRHGELRWNIKMDPSLLSSHVKDFLLLINQNIRLQLSLKRERTFCRMQKNLLLF